MKFQSLFAVKNFLIFSKQLGIDISCKISPQGLLWKERIRPIQNLGTKKKKNWLLRFLNPINWDFSPTFNFI